MAKVRDNGQKAARVLLEKNEKDTLAEKERMLQEAAQSKDRGLTGNKEKVEDVLDGLLHIVLGKDISSK